MSGAGARAARLILVALAVLVAAPWPSAAQPPGPTAGTPEQVKVGVFLAGLHRLDFIDGSFAADFWIWAVNDAGQAERLEAIDIVNEISKRTEALSRTVRDGQRWEEQRIHGVLQTKWDTWHFPFDRQKLRIELEDSFTTADEVVYVADTANSGIDPGIILPGWRVIGWSIEADAHGYATNFGNPDGRRGSRYPRLVFTVEVEREGAWLFLNLSLGALVAFTMLALSFRMNPALPPTFAGRMGVIAASVFTVAISMRASQSVVAYEFGATLVDRIHLATLVAGFVAALGATAARYLAEKNCEPQALDLDRRVLVPFTVVYVLFVGMMVAGSVLGFHPPFR